MYLAHIRHWEKDTRFIIRESYRDIRGVLRSKDLYDLGSDPEVFIKYVGPRGFYIDPELADEVSQKAHSYTYEELEGLFWPFLDPTIKTTISNFSHGNYRAGRRFRGKSRKEREKERLHLKKRLDESLHPFDRRRLLFLKFAQINLEAMLDQAFPFLQWPLDKSRDEIEHTIDFMEMELRPWEMRGYLYTIFDIPSRLKPRMSRFIPDVQDLEIIDKYFLEELCRLNGDRTFLDEGARELDARGCHPYLRKYLIYYFDTFFYSKGAGYIGGRFRKDGTYQESRSALESQAECLKEFGINHEEFSRMDEKSLTSLFRKKAMRLHPDKGGDHEKFIRLKQAYNRLLRLKGW